MIKKLLFLFCVMVPFSVSAMTIGSDSAVSRFNNVVTITNGIRVAGFAALYGGFSFAGGTVTALFDSFFPVSGSIAINGGNLVLNRDLILNDVLTVGPLGNIYGNGFRLDMPVIDTLPTLTGPAFACAPYYNSSVTSTNDAETVSWSFDDQFLLVFGDDGFVNLYKIINNQLTFSTSIGTGGYSYNNAGQVAWRPTGYIFALAHAHGSAGNPSVRTFSYNPSTNVITQISDIAVTADCFACAWHPSGLFLALGTNDTYGYGTTNQVIIYPVTSGGVLGTPVTFTLTSGVYYECLAWDITGSYLAVGMIINGANPQLVVLRVNTSPLAIVGINASATTTTPAKSVGSLDWGKGPDYLAVGLTGNDAATNIQVYSFNPGTGGVGAGTLTVLASVSGLGHGIQAISWSPAGTCFAASSEEVGLTAFTNFYSFNSSTITLISSFLHTGLTASEDYEAIRWSNTGAYVANGSDLSGTTPNVDLYGVPGSSCYTWSNLTIEQASNTFYHDLCVTFTGYNTWTGRGGIVEFASSCIFYIAPNSGLMFRDMTLVMDGSNVIVPLDSTSTLSFNNMTFVLDNNYTFSLGNLEIIGDVTVEGEGSSFIFSSTAGGLINSNSRFIFDVDTTFMYAPINSSRTNFMFTDNTSQLVLNTATLSTSSVGMQLLQGQIVFDGLCMVVNQGNSLGSSLQLGDGINSANDVFVRWLPACNVELAQGILRDSNI